MKVLAAIVVPPHLSVSGAARAAEELSAALAPHCNITVASMLDLDGRNLAADGARSPARFPVRTSLPFSVPESALPNRLRTPLYMSDIPDIVCNGNYDIVHLHNPMPAMELERIARACTARGIPYVISTHGFNEIANGIEIYGFGPLQRLIWQHLIAGPIERVVSNAASVFALSPADIDIVRGMGFGGNDLPIVSNGVRMPSLAESAADRTILERLGIPTAKQDGEFTCMFLANHTPNKGLPILLEAFARLDRPYLLLVGGDKRGNIEYDRYIRECRSGQQIVVTGRLSDDEVTALFRRSDLFVFPTLADTFPLVVLEAMSHGVPVLASRVGGIPYQVTEQCGALVSPGDADELAAAIDRLAQEPETLKAMGRSARARVAAEFTWEHAAKQALAGYERVLHRNKSLAA